MNIRKAVLKAQVKQKGITRISWMPQAITVIPTNTTACFLLVPLDEKEKIGRRWNPTVEDILAKDWIVTN